MAGGKWWHKSWGAEPLHDGRWCFSLWAPDVGAVSVELGGTAIPLESEADGWWSIEAPAQPGAAYRFLVDGKAYPDPAARAQQGDVHGPSLLVDPADFAWQSDWSGLPWTDAVVYELHLGTFTEEGTFAAAARELPRLRDLSVTMVELMPVAQFDGRRGWGYDGVLPYAPHRAYGSPDDFRRFVDSAHGLGIGVLLDVVYNHLGPSGNYLSAWCPSFFHPERRSPWGQGIAYEARPVRDYFIENALCWLGEYRLDGLRLDAVHAIEDHSPVHFLDELGERVRAADWGRPIHLVTEDERNPVRYFGLNSGQHGAFDATWNDDWHHAVHCLLTGEDEAYYASFAVDPLADIEIALRDGYVEQGQRRSGESKPRGEPSAALPRSTFVNFLGNHDQVGNRARGERLHQLVSDRTALRVVTALTLLSPFVPMIFMGDEFLTDAPFLFFADFTGDLAEAVRKGRAEEFAKFAAFGGEVPDPISPKSFAASKIGKPQRRDQRDHEDFVRQLLHLRRAEIAPLLATDAVPKAVVTREGPAIEATWDFGRTRLSLRACLGDGKFAAHDDPLFVIAEETSPFAFSAALLADRRA
ncbi:malto-oligosyltrehalose trehalohydrolase [Novosphingobium sp. TCA1]|uniref:malto-oligosyltrehalose trehalohydrolase n=1 Tax=Novosphingobium sp. TCA1 TaxID=2682474 RepID=UPI00130CF9F0|nr:malto-oligosyltrehalose trehalohydrolase [Novosphingobium sp. TCA1]GFE74924.1 malto-oligosyltrehalose trehalohydrolase [Novosphingobium sp. TCA1]